jgi:NAD kinase
MERLTENRIVLVVRKTRLDDLVARFNTRRQAKFYIEHLGADFSLYEAEHDRYQAAVSDSQSRLRRLGRLETLDRSFLTNFIFGADDTVVVLGQDGLVANTLKYLGRQNVVGVNPDPQSYDGVLLPFSVRDLAGVVPAVFTGERSVKKVTMAKAVLDNGQTLYGVNDLFIGVKSHVSARYLLRMHDREEPQSSSGIIVSTGLGSTGWLKSLITGAVSIAKEVTDGGVSEPAVDTFPWDADHLYFTVREPFPSKVSAATLVFGKITPSRPLRLVSQNAESGVIFSDGIEKDFLEFNSGTHATITVADKKGRLVI